MTAAPTPSVVIPSVGMKDSTAVAAAAESVQKKRSADDCAFVWKYEFPIAGLPLDIDHGIILLQWRKVISVHY